jgi:hypothetical protein
MRFLRFAFLSTLILFFSACDKSPKSDTPEGVLERYVQTAFGARGITDKKKLEDLSTGEALGFIQRMNEEDFRKQFIDSQLSLVSLKLKDLRKEQEGDVSLVYEIVFKAGRGANVVVQSNKKIAFLTKDPDLVISLDSASAPINKK